jgi:hypothetical protein
VAPRLAVHTQVRRRRSCFAQNRIEGFRFCNNARRLGVGMTVHRHGRFDQAGEA